jgi:hypothetical protein
MRIMIALSVGLFFTGVPANSQLTKQAKIERLVAITHGNGNGAVEDMMKSIFAGSMPTTTTREQKAAAEKVSQKIIENTKAISEKMRPLFVQVYSEVYSDDEIDAMLAFYESATGRAMVKKQPLIMSKVMTALMPEIQRLAKETAPK